MARLPGLGSEGWPVRWAVADQSGRDDTGWYRVRAGVDAEPVVKETDDGQTCFALPSATTNGGDNA